MLDESNLGPWGRGRERLVHLAEQLGQGHHELYNEIYELVFNESFTSLLTFLGQPKYAWMGTDNAVVLYKAWKARLS